MERVIRLRIEEEESLDALNRLYAKGWKTASIIPYKGADFRNQYLIGLELSEEDEERFKYDVDEDEDPDEKETE